MNRSLSRVTLALGTALIALFSFGSVAQAVPARPASPPPTDYWQDMGFILMAHQGGEWDFPPNTMYAYKQAIAIGADMIDMDGWVTSNGEIVLTHDRDANDNSNAPDNTFITSTPLSQLKTYDFAYKWTPHGSAPGTEPPFRGIATGNVPPPTGFSAADFKIPTFGEVLAAFPDTPINIELKQVDGLTPAEITDTAEKMAAILASHPGHDENVIINSFGQEMLDAVHLARPEHKSFGGSQDATIGYVGGANITPTPVALEPPDLFQLAAPPAAPTRTVPILKPTADYDGYKIFVWGSDKDPEQDTPPFYARLIAEGADSYNTPTPTTLAAYLCAAGIAKPDGTPRCPGQICPEGQTGIAPDNCVDVPATASKVVLAPVKGSIKAGKLRKVKLKVSATAGLPGKVTVKLKSSNRRVTLPKTVSVTILPKGTAIKTITVRASKKAKGKAKITATSGTLKASATYTIKPACKSGRKGSGHLCGQTNHL